MAFEFEIFKRYLDKAKTNQRLFEALETQP